MIHIRRFLIEVSMLLVFLLSNASAMQTKYNCNDYLRSLGVFGPEVQIEELKSIQKSDTIDNTDIKFIFREICYNHDIMIAAFDISSENVNYLILGEGVNADNSWNSMTYLGSNKKLSTDDLTVADIIEKRGYEQIWVVDIDIRDENDVPVREYSSTNVIDEETNGVTVFIMIEDGLIQFGKMYNVLLFVRPWLEIDDPTSYDYDHQVEAIFKFTID